MHPPPPTGLHLSIERLARRFGRRWALARLSFEVPAGAALLITGANGSGKTTLLRCLATALKPHEGVVRADGRPLWAHRGTLRRDIGYLAHASRLYEDLSARDNLRVWRDLQGAGSRVDLEAALRAVHLPTDRSEPIRTFSAGMRRRLALAVALLGSPRLLLLDEPFSALDPDGRALMRSLLEARRAQGVTLVIASHLPAEAAPLCTHALHLDAGRIAWHGNPDEALARVGTA